MDRDVTGACQNPTACFRRRDDVARGTTFVRPKDRPAPTDRAVLVPDHKDHGTSRMEHPGTSSADVDRSGARRRHVDVCEVRDGPIIPAASTEEMPDLKRPNW